MNPETGGQGGGPGSGQTGGALGARLSKVREDLLTLAVAGVPMGVAQWAIARAVGQVTGQPWHALFIIAPLAVLAWALWRRAVRLPELRLGARWLGFLGVYVLIFVVAAQSRVVDWQRSLTGYEAVRPASPLGLSWLGDWRYRLVGRRAADGLAVVLMEPAPPAVLRAELVQLIGVAGTRDVSGLALDYYFLESTGADALLCHVLAGAGFDVFAGFGIDRRGSAPIERPYPDTLGECLPREHRGHLLVFQEGDGRVRSLPLQFRGEERLNVPALSLRAAESLAENRPVRQPENGLLQFVPPGEGLSVIHYDSLARDGPLLTGKFLVVGGRTEHDRFRTPEGEVPGVMLHAFALHTLLSGRFIERAPDWLTVVVLLVACYGLLVLAARGAPPRALVGLAGLLTVAVVAGAALAMGVALVWIDVIYVLTGMWGFVVLLAIRWTAGRMETDESGGPSAAASTARS